MLGGIIADNAYKQTKLFKTHLIFPRGQKQFIRPAKSNTENVASCSEDITMHNPVTFPITMNVHVVMAKGKSINYRHQSFYYPNYFSDYRFKFYEDGWKLFPDSAYRR